MKSYVLLFIALILTIVIAISSVGIISTLRAVRSFDMGPASADLRLAGETLAALYRGTGDVPLRPALEGAASRIDEAQAKLSQADALKGHLYAGFMINILLVAVLCLAAGFLLWLGTYRLLIRPIAFTIREVNDAAGEPGNRRVTLRGVREVRFLQASLNDLLQKVAGYQRRILQIERENIGRFLVHQIRNSITPIRLSASSAKSMAAGSAGITRSMDLVLEEAGKISDLMDQFKTLYKFPALIVSEIEINTLVRTLASAYPGIRVAYALGDVVISADRNLLEQAIKNIVQNGIEAAGSTDRVLISVEGGASASLAVSDEGCGMTEAEKGRMFDEYYTTKSTGMGIGLAFVKRVVDSHRFRILVDSAPGRGTSIRMVFRG